MSRMGNITQAILVNSAVMVVLLLAMLVPVLIGVPGKKRWQFDLASFCCS